MIKHVGRAILIVAWLISTGAVAIAAEAKRPAEWDKVVEEARKEGKIVLAIPPATELRTALEPLLKQKFGLEAELVSAPGPKNASRIAAEKKAGVNYFDAIICGTGTAAGLTHDGMLEPMESFWILPEVKDAKQWWGGHIWEDNLSTHKFLYSFLADVSTHSTWYNTSLAKPQELRAFDDYLNPKWKGRIGFSDPRVPSSGQSIWSFMWEHRGEEFLKKLVQQELFLTRDLRQLADAVAKGKVVLAFGLGRSQTEPFIKAGLPLKPAPVTKEGLPASNGFGVIGVIKDSAPSQCHKSVHQLVSEPRRTGMVFQSDVEWHAPARCEYQVAQRFRHRRGQRRNDRAGVSPRAQSSRRQIHQSASAGGQVCRDGIAIA